VAAKTVIVKQMAAHMEEFRALTLACNQKELEKRLLYLQARGLRIRFRDFLKDPDTLFRNFGS
jgi:hypothetical protein